MPESDRVYLTFDDGPTPGVTEWILDQLAEYDAKATFFCLGKNAEQYPHLYRMIVDAGHAIGNHTYSHQKGWGMSLERYLEDVDFANDILHTDLFRPPYARIKPSQAHRISERYNIVMWDVLSRDYSRLTIKAHFEIRQTPEPAEANQRTQQDVISPSMRSSTDCRFSNVRMICR